jgi:hypothetical protein
MTRPFYLASSLAALMVISSTLFAAVQANAQDVGTKNRQIVITPKLKKQEQLRVDEEQAEDLALKPEQKKLITSPPETSVDETADADVTDEEKADAIANDATSTEAADVVAEAEDEEPVIIKKVKRKKVIYVYDDQDDVGYQSSGHAGSSCGQNNYNY